MYLVILEVDLISMPFSSTVVPFKNNLSGQEGIVCCIIALKRVKVPFSGVQVGRQ